MVAHGYDDVEGDIIERARAIVGPKCVIGVELDPHCHLTMKRVAGADIIVLYKEFPHTDVVERAEDVLDLVLATLRGQVKPVMSVYDCRQIQSYPTTLQPMRGLVDRIKAMEGKDGILSVSIAHCFPYGDVAEIGTRVLVIADGDKKKADALATRLGEELVALRGKTQPPSFDVAAGVGAGRRLQRPAGGDRRSRRQCRRRRAVGQYRHRAPPDRQQGRECLPRPDLGSRSPCASASMPALGRRSPLRFGGKIAPASGQPVDAEVEIIGLRRDAWQSFGPTQVPVGDCAAMRVGGVDVVLITKRTQATRPGALHQSRHRSDAEEDRRGEVDQPLHGGLRADRQEGDLCRIRAARSPRDYRKVPYTKVAAPDLAARPGDITRPDPMTVWPKPALDLIETQKPEKTRPPHQERTP